MIEFVLEETQKHSLEGVQENKTDLRDLLQEFRALYASDNPDREELASIWEYIHVLNSWQLIDSLSRKAIEKMLWKGAVDWKIIPGFHSFYPYEWLSQKSVRRDKIYRDFLLKSGIK